MSSYPRLEFALLSNQLPPLSDNTHLRLQPRAQCCVISLAILGVWTLCTGPAWGLPLGDIGQTQLQQDTGNAVQTVCGGFNGGANATNALQQDLFSRCREMVQTANDIIGEGSTEFSLALTADQLASALQQVATEEAATAGTMATETASGQTGNVGTRLDALRGGAQGFTTSGLQFGLSDRVITLADLGGFAAGYAGNPNGGGLGASRWGGFINGTIGFGDKDSTAREDGFDFDTVDITLGLDYRLSDASVLGASVGYNRQETDFDSSATVAGGEIESDGYTLSVYGLYYLKLFYLNGLVSYGANDYDLERRILVTPGAGSTALGANRTATADTESDQFTLSLTGGQDFTQEQWTFGPYLRLDYLNIDIDGYTENGASGLNLEVDSQNNIESLTSVLGGSISYAISQEYGVLTPHGRLEWIHEYEDDARNITARYVNDPNNVALVARTDSPDEDYFSLGVGISGVFRGNLQAFFDYETTLDLDDLEEHLFTIGARMEF